MIDSDLLTRLRRLDEVTLLELLDINSNEIVDAFLDKIEDNLNFLRSKVYDQD